MDFEEIKQQVLEDNEARYEKIREWLINIPKHPTGNNILDCINKEPTDKMNLMKSIKEFATEYAQDKYLPVQTSQAVKAGANYVLEEIERIVNSAIENKSMTIPTWRLDYIIKQLKK